MLTILLLLSLEIKDKKSPPYLLLSALRYHAAGNAKEEHPKLKVKDSKTEREQKEEVSQLWVLPRKLFAHKDQRITKKYL